MNKKLLFIISAFLLLIISAVFYLSSSKNAKVTSQQSLDTNTQIPVEKKATLIIDFGNGETLAYDHSFSAQLTAYDLLKERLAEQEIDLQSETYDFGVMIKSIKGYESKDNTFWLYSVNDQPATVGADKYILSDKDVVQFSYSSEGE